MNTAIIITSVSVIILAFISALESALNSFNRLRYEVDKKQGKRYAIVMEELLEREDELKASLRLAYDLFLVIAVVSLASIFSALFISILVAFFGLLILTKLLPMAVASFNGHSILENLYFLIKAFFVVFSPFVKRDNTPSIQEREVSGEMVIFQNALNFSEVKVRECMIPRTEICAIHEDASIETLLAQFAESKYSRIIVYRENLDRITGYVHSKDLFSGGKPIRDIIRDIDFVPEEMDAQTLLANLIKNKRSIAVVNDQYGGTAGIVTLEDLIEEIFGEISDELDKEDLIEKRVSENEFIFSARLEIKYLNKTYDLDIPENDDYETLGGFITWFNENIPVEGEQLKYEKFEFSILKTTINRVESVSLRIVGE
ncbi:MAG: hypothetical protein CVU12_00355 [Bacteroidetes bacterium HGW-Bacteroidetes-7]|jgi:CBS domain containing-hemolysin-like protein|nr:MAG: hypothetical protein CVU12_00355 [Bacteroidetes bacterium HGW-Bacteroidetes-7]